MPSYSTENIRNIALVGHAGSGKTTLAEALLHRAGIISTPGSIEKGTTFLDFDPQEKEYQYSLNPAVASLDHGNAHINLIDTPGYPDFLGQALGALPAVETAAVIINAEAGIETVTQRMMERAAAMRLCRLIIINKIDAEDVDLPRLLDQIRETFGKECLPINLPSRNGQAVVDCFFASGGDTDFSSVAEAHTALIDQVVEVDEELMATYLEQGEINPEQLHAPFEAALREAHLIPVCFVSARTGVGIPELLDIFARLMPNPKEGNPAPFLRGEGEEAEEVYPEPEPDKPVLAHVFKVTIDPFIGRIGLFRIHQGTITRDSQLFIDDGRKPFRVAHLLKPQGKDYVELDKGIPGDICAVAKVEEIHYDAVLHDSHDDDHIHLRPLKLPTPMFALAVHAKSRGDEQKLSDALLKLQAEDPCFVVER
ncbi:MAG: GTP-binding protein, partial [Gammaproteobacteria bacterium]